MFNKEENDLFAYFPESIRSGVFGTMFECYGQGQHSLCDRNYIMESREVDAEIYKPLLHELQNLYKDIEII